MNAKKKPQCAIPVGTRVEFCNVNGGLGASERDELARTTGEVFRNGDRGVVAFHQAAPDWFYVEVESRKRPGTKLYVGVNDHWVRVLEEA